MINQYQTTKDNIARFNKPNPLAEYLVPFVGDKKEVKIADLGSGPYSIIGSHYDGVRVEVYHSDTQDFADFWKKNKATPSFNIAHQDMERMTYPDNLFDIVHCVNALDHTINALAAVREMIRICKIGGWIYIDCCLDQLDTGHKHYWNVKDDGRFENERSRFDLKDFGFTIKFVDNGGERRYNHIIAILKKV